jgi:hypothetical protein
MTHDRLNVSFRTNRKGCIFLLTVLALLQIIINPWLDRYLDPLFLESFLERASKGCLRHDLAFTFFGCSS